MKRLLITILALTLCFAGCKEEAKVPDTPEVKHTEEVKAPVEETPTEPTKEPIDEIPDEKVIILPEPDENTKVITIEFPEDFPEEPYTEPNLVSPEEFEWGEYVPFVKYAYTWLGDFLGPVYTYAFLGETVNDIYEGNEIYSKLNQKYSSNNSITKNLTFYGNKVVGLEDLYYKSHIIYISEDAQEIGILSMIDTQKERNTDVTWENYFSGWDANYKLYNNDNVVFEETIEYEKSEFYASHRSQADSSDYSGEIQEGDNYIVEITRKIINLYDKSKERMLYEIKLPDDDIVINGEEKYSPCQFVQLVKDDYALIEFRTNRPNREDRSTDYNYAIYLLDLNSKEITLIEECACHAKLSPDGRYLMYRLTKWSEDENGKTVIPQCALYVKNLETNETVKFDYEMEDATSTYFKDYSKFISYDVVNWINATALKNALK